MSNVRMTTTLLQWVSVATLVGALLGFSGHAQAQTDPLPSWKDGAAKDAITTFVQQTTDDTSPQFVPPEQRIATFDQDGTLWVSHPMYAQLMFCLDRVPAVVKQKPELAKVEPFATVLSGDRAAIAKLGKQDLEKIAAATLSGMDVEQFQAEVTEVARQRARSALAPAVHRSHVPADAGGDQLPARQWLRALHRNRRGPDFVRVYAERVYGIPPEHVIGSAGATHYEHDKQGKPVLIKGALAPAQRRQCR